MNTFVEYINIIMNIFVDYINIIMNNDKYCILIRYSVSHIFY